MRVFQQTIAMFFVTDVGHIQDVTEQDCINYAKNLCGVFLVSIFFTDIRVPWNWDRKCILQHRVNFLRKILHFLHFFLRKIFLIWDLTLKNKVKFSVWRNIKLSQILQGCRLLKSHASCGCRKIFGETSKLLHPNKAKPKLARTAFLTWNLNLTHGKIRRMGMHPMRSILKLFLWTRRYCLHSITASTNEQKAKGVTSKSIRGRAAPVGWHQQTRKNIAKNWQWD